MKVMFFIQGFDGGGAEKQCALLANALAKDAAFDVVLLHFHEGVNFKLVDRSCVRAIRIETDSNYDPRNVLRVVTITQNEKPDIVFSWLVASDVYAGVARLLVRQFKWLMSERNSRYPLEPRSMLRNLIGTRADTVVSNGLAGDRYWERRGVSADRRAVIGNILPDSWFEASARTNSPPLVCYAGRLEPQKNIVLIAAAFAQLSMRKPDVHSAIIGSGTLENAAKTAAARIGSHSISFIPFQDDIRSIYESASVFVNMSYYEGTPNTVIENMALGNRLVLSRIPAHVALLGEGYPFFLEVDASPESLANMIASALISPVTQDEHRLHLDALSAMRADFVAQQYKALFRKLARLDRSTSS